MQYDMLAIPKGMTVKEPTRKPDMYSKRGIPYWFGPNWVCKAGKKTYGRILPVLNERTQCVELHMLSVDGNLSYIEGSIQREFQDWLSSNKNDIVPWREDLQVDCMLLGVKPEELMLSDWEYITKE